MSHLMFNERKAKKQMNKYEGSTGAGAGYYRDQLDVLEQEPAGSRSYIREIKDFLYVLIFSLCRLNHFVCTEKN